MKLDNGQFKIGGHTYQHNSYGGVSQVGAKPFAYNQAYNETYNTEAYKRDSLRLMQIRLDIVKSACGHPNSLLDFGYGNGAFLTYASSFIPNCFGFDVAETNYHEGKKWERINYLEQKGKPMVATFWDSLEHLENPEEVVRGIDAEYVCISLPWFTYELDFNNWHHRKPDEHLHHFTPDALITLMQDCNYRLCWLGNPEDEIRKGKGFDNNIMTATFTKD